MSGESPALFIALGIIGIVFFIFTRIYVARREFYRRNVAGLDAFDGYGKAVLTKTFERTLKVVGLLAGFAGLTYIVVGLIKLRA
jgi:hypothetical protein